MTTRYYNWRLQRNRYSSSAHLLVVEDGLAQLALDDLLRWRCLFLLAVQTLNVLLKVELDHVLVTTQVTVEHRVGLAGYVSLDLLTGAEGEDRVDEGADPLVAGPDVVLDGVQIEKLGGTIFALVYLASLLLSLVLSLDMRLLADVQGKCFSTEAAKVFLGATPVLLELVLYSKGGSLEDLSTHVTLGPCEGRHLLLH